jgi:hypothetical protein
MAMLSSITRVDSELLDWCVSFLCFCNGHAASVALSLSVLPSIRTSCFDCSLSYKPPSPVLLYRIKSGTENAAYLLVRHRLGTSKICRQRVTAGRLVGDIVSRRRISDLLRA